MLSLSQVKQAGLIWRWCSCRIMHAYQISAWGVVTRHTWEGTRMISTAMVAKRHTPLVITMRAWWRHKERDGVSNHRHLNCLFNRLFRCRSKKISKLCFSVGGIHRWPVNFPAQKASNAENVSVWWRHHVGNDIFCCKCVYNQWPAPFTNMD